MPSVFRILLPLLGGLYAQASQRFLSSPYGAVSVHDASNPYYELPHEIRRVAVIGAGPNGLQHAGTLLGHGFEVRLFERAPKPGGIWFSTKKTPVQPPFPGTPTSVLAYTPDIPDELPLSRIYHEGDEGLSLDWRVREQWNPSPAWRNMTTTAPSFIMKLPNIEYPPDIPWKMHVIDVQRHVRQYASSLGINSNDEEHEDAISYSTRVERVQKSGGKWALVLRKFTPLHDGTLLANWWTESFDAVVVAAGAPGQGDATYLPPIPGIEAHFTAFPDQVFHAGQYREPSRFANKNVLIVGAFLSSIGISREILTVTRSVTISARPPKSDLRQLIRRQFSPNVTFIGEITSFVNSSSEGVSDIRDVSMLLSNGSTVQGFDYIMFATGYRTSFPFLVDHHNDTIKGNDEPDTLVPPIVTNGLGIRSLFWTGHYIADPTLAFARLGAFDEASYQALAFAKVWSRKARLPSIRRMWNMYPGAGYSYNALPIVGIRWIRLFVAWLNDASLEFGGRLVSPPDVRKYQAYSYYGVSDASFWTLWPEDFVRQEEATPRSQWEAYNGTYSQPEGSIEVEGGSPPDIWNRLGLELDGDASSREEPHWAEFTDRW